MAERLVYVALSNGQMVRTTLVGFEWAKGLSASQKMKNVVRLHEGFLREYPGRKVLEISRYSDRELGKKLSAFNLMMPLKDGRKVSVECAYQAGKVFEKGGPYTDLLNGTSMDAKKDERLKTSGSIIGFELENESFPTVPRSFFYNWLYIHALHSQKELADEVMEYDAFTDIAFNQEKSSNCQAEAAALYVALRKMELLDEALRSKEDFIRIAYHTHLAPVHETGGRDKKKKEARIEEPKPDNKKFESSFTVGDRLVHPKFGEGSVEKIELKPDSATLHISFSVGLKQLDEKWILNKCTRIE